jgi:hypothetical protein
MNEALSTIILPAVIVSSTINISEHIVHAISWLPPRAKVYTPASMGLMAVVFLPV